MSRTTQVIVALDHKTASDALDLVDMLGESVAWYKVGSVLFTREGASFIKDLKERGKNIFLDLKFHDIPNTVAGAVTQIVEFGVDMFTVHASGGSLMLRKAIEASQTRAAERGVVAPEAIAVTLLTSMSEDHLQQDFSLTLEPSQIVKRLVGMVKRAGGTGVVASPQELVMIREEFGDELKVITPGVRPQWAAKGDQQRVMTPAQAAQRGADFLVIGRPIIAASDPKAAAERIQEELEGVSHG